VAALACVAALVIVLVPVSQTGTRKRAPERNGFETVYDSRQGESLATETVLRLEMTAGEHERQNEATAVQVGLGRVSCTPVPPAPLPSRVLNCEIAIEYKTAYPAPSRTRSTTGERRCC
jgi:hypothetical protein